MSKKNEYYPPEQIDYELDHSGRFPEDARGALSKALSYLPKEIVDFIVESHVFLSLDKETKGEYWSFDDFRLKNRKGFVEGTPFLRQLVSLCFHCI